MIDYKNKDLFWQSSVDKQLKLSFSGGDIVTNEDIYQESMEIKESLCSEQQLKFGCCEASQFKIKIAHSFTSHIGQTLDVSMTLNGDTENPFKLGTYKVASDKPTADRIYREITAYDVMYDIINSDVTDWYNAMFPKVDSKMTLREFRNAFLEHLGVEYEDVLLVNDYMDVSRTLTESNESKLTGKTVVNAICEINGCFGHINREGIFTFVRLKPLSQALYPSNELFPDHDVFPSTEGNLTKIENENYKSCQFEDFSSALISQLQIRMEENDIGCVFPNDEDNTNSYVVQGNFLVYGKGAEELEKIARNLYEQIKVVSYRPCTIVAKSNPCLEVGDGFRIYSRYKEIRTYALSRSIKGIQALTDTFTNNGTQYFTQTSNGVNEKITSLVGRTNKLVRNVEQMSSEISETKVYAGKVASDAQKNAIKHTDDALVQYSTTEEMNSAIKQTADNINSTVEKNTTEIASVRDSVEDVNKFSQGLQSSITDIQNQIDGVVNTYYLKGKPTLENEPANEWTTDSDKDSHIGDTYYDRDTGYGYRFIKDGNTYIWEQIVDSDAVKAMEMASKAQDIADGKRRVFFGSAYPPYDKGDLWVKGSNSDIMVCLTPRLEDETYNVNTDFVKASKYTDDTKANEVAKNLSTNYYNKSTIDQKNNEITASVEEKITQGDDKVLEDVKAEIKLLPHTITLGVENVENNTKAGITISLKDENGNVISSGQGNIELTGLVTVTDLATAGKTTISGSNITTGTLTGIKINCKSDVPSETWITVGNKYKSIDGNVYDGTTQIGSGGVFVKSSDFGTISITPESVSFYPKGVAVGSNARQSYLDFDDRVFRLDDGSQHTITTQKGFYAYETDGTYTYFNPTSVGISSGSYINFANGKFSIGGGNLYRSESGNIVANNFRFNEYYYNGQYSSFEPVMCHYAHTIGLAWMDSYMAYWVDRTWMGQWSDARLKENIKPINQDYVDAIGQVDMTQFYMKNPIYAHELRTGPIAQDLVSSFEKYGIDPFSYLIMNKHQESAEDDTEYYEVDKTEFLIGRVAYDEKRIKELEERLSRLEEK